MNGIVYVATGDQFTSLFRIAIRYLRVVEPEVPVTLFTDSAGRVELEPMTASLGFEIVELEEPGYCSNDKIQACERSSYERTIYLDVDTLTILPFCQDLFAALEHAPILARSAGIAFNQPWETERYPRAIPQYNSGVLPFDRSATRDLWPAWRALRAQHPGPYDQATLRAAILDCRIAVSELPPSYNYLRSNLLTEPVRIIHCHVAGGKTRMLDDEARESLIAEIKCIRPPAVTLHSMTIWTRGSVPKRLPLDALFFLLKAHGRRVARFFRRLRGRDTE